MKKIIGICGKARHGKTTAANYLVKKYGYARISYADALKEMIVGALVDSPPPIEIASQEFSEMTEAYWRDVFYVNRTAFSRWLMQFVGTDIVRNRIAEHYWLARWLKTYRGVPDRVVVPDVRFRNEAAQIRGMGGQIWRIERVFLDGDPEESQLQAIEHGADHESETEMLKIPEDRLVQASWGIKNIYKAVDEILEAEKVRATSKTKKGGEAG